MTGLPRRVLVLLALVVIWVAAGVVFVFWGYGWKAVSRGELLLHDSEESAAYGRSLDVKGTVAKGQPVAVLFDVYGKDYWGATSGPPTTISAGCFVPILFLIPERPKPVLPSRLAGPGRLHRSSSAHSTPIFVPDKP